MIVRTDKKKLEKALGIVSRAIPAHTTMAVLQDFFVSAALPGNLLITGSDLDFSIKMRLEVMVEEPGELTVPAKMLTDIVKKMPDGEIVLREVDNTLQILSGKIQFRIPVKDVVDYPVSNVRPSTDGFRISQLELKDMLEVVLPAIDPKSQSTMLTGVNLEAKEDRLRIIGLNGHRISIRKTTLSAPAEDVKVTVPGLPFIAVSKLLEKSETEIEVLFGDKCIFFRTFDMFIWIRLLDGEYFNVDQIIQNNADKHLKLKTDELKACLDRATLMCPSSGVERGRPMVFKAEEGILHVSMPSMYGQMEEDLETEQTGDAAEIGLNPNLLKDIVATIPDEEVTLDLSGRKSPVFIEGENYFHLLLPVNY